MYFGIDDPQHQALLLGEPIPGYSGVNRRVQADNIFGMTYAEARKKAHESQGRIDQDKGETIRMNSTFVPEYLKNTMSGG